ncbi:MAG: hypothetical protein JXM68_06140 [Sedimentisphaerales bacterium]|nr:hypothetical protein [Sedimentisphaerales bacterium]
MTVLSFLFFCLTCLSGCTEHSDTEYDPATDPVVNPASMFEAPPADRSLIAENESIIITFRGSPSTMNPLFTSSYYDNIAVGLVYEGLFVAGTDMVTRPNPAVVEKLTESDDHMVITIKIKDNLLWQDGTKITAHDFAFAVEMLKNDKVPCYTYKSEMANLADIEVLDDYTLRYTMAQPMATRLDLVNYPYAPLPRHIFEKDMVAFPDLKSGPYYQQQSQKPVGNGPYKLIEWVENEKMVFERWEDYPGNKPYLKRIIFIFQTDIQMSMLSFKAGQTDALEYVSGKQCALETNGPDFTAIGHKYVMPEWIYDYTGWNMDGSNPFFIDKRVRQAMAHVDNFDLINHKLAYNMLTPCYGIFHPTSWMFNKDVVRFDRDLDRAAQLLDEAGWKLGRDGWRYKTVNFVLIEKEVVDVNTDEKRMELRKVFLNDGQEYTTRPGEVIKETGSEKRKFEFTLLSTATDGLPRPTTTIYQTDLLKLGVDMKIRLMEWTSFMNRVLKHDMEAWGAAWGSGTDPDGSKGCFRTDDYDNGRNYGGYFNAEVDQLFADAMVEFDREKRAELYRRIQAIIYEEQPYLFHDNRVSISVLHKRIRGMEKGSLGFCYSYPGLLNLWVPKGQELRPVK